MSHYVHGTSLKYEDYLQIASVEEGITSQISKSSREIIISGQSLADAHAKISQVRTDAWTQELQTLTGTVNAGFEQISFDMERISDGIHGLGASVRAGFDKVAAVLGWGFSELILGSSQMNESLNEILKTLRQSDEAWNYRQFDNARDAYRRGLFDDALECITKALTGDPRHSGFRLDYRFHMFLGMLHFGDPHVGNVDSTVVDLPKAEAAFIEAAKYARKDHPIEAAEALVKAAQSAYIQVHIERSLTHIEAALELIPKDELQYTYPERIWCDCHFHWAKILMQQGELEAGLTQLKKAIRVNRNYSVRASCDADFFRHKDLLDALLDKLRSEAESQLEDLTVIATETCNLLLQFPTVKLGDITSRIESVRRSDRSYFALLDAIHAAENILKDIEDAKKEGEGSLRREIELQRSLAADKAASKPQIESRGSQDKAMATWISVPLVILCTLVGVHQCNSVADRAVGHAIEAKRMEPWLGVLREEQQRFDKQQDEIFLQLPPDQQKLGVYKRPEKEARVISGYDEYGTVYLADEQVESFISALRDKGVPKQKPSVILGAFEKPWFTGSWLTFLAWFIGGALASICIAQFVVAFRRANMNSHEKERQATDFKSAELSHSKEAERLERILQQLQSVNVTNRRPRLCING